MKKYNLKCFGYITINLSDLNNYYDMLDYPCISHDLTFNCLLPRHHQEKHKTIIQKEKWNLIVEWDLV